MRIKKSPQADLNNKRSMFTLIGLVITLGFAYICFEWSKSNVEKINPDELTARVDEEEEVENTTQEEEEIKEPEPEPEILETPEVPEQLNVVDNSVETQNTMQPNEGDQNTAINIPTVFNGGNEPEKDDDVPLVKVQKKAEFPGGPDKLKEYLKKNLSYPDIAREEGVEGKVFVKFVVGKDGTIKDVKVIRSVDPLLDKEAVRVVSEMPKWTPAQQHDKPCASYFTLPVNFVLNK